ncbi:MAG: ABC transporter substrate-binding protein [Deltaproteobacteria bacterium CG_4_8_14_3_um_filter_51_11]|nr:twin-arginine translocation signal domain-containing protein [bacterium]OIP38625.1 MAG: ABC transporter substrate-binding protein [Desulfobacteraceae bacterium CG2_30_51_40]PIP45397.1 MAG: ABC transporter substrate-binding protein [Deltaproteobacteria bacterium CG23_combo_of_CG06-09_8_20_14_all_51_20]PIX20568.1 MAG: ABC transporter substrate-binding protein [Deltaproteobacteria bacterium CG_4_8_14_3_um_filter_51_11]PIY22684.1 MAG: ABC transporter substrate-binding protein [Deltaproteobacteri
MCQDCGGITRRDFIKAAVVGGAALGSGIISLENAFAADQNLRFSTWHPPVSREVKTVWTPMMEELKKRSNGKLGYSMYAGGALGKGPDHFDIVNRGMSDLGYFTATWTPGRFPLTDVLSLAVWVDGKDLAADIGNAVYQKVLKDEFKDVKVLELNGCIQSFIWTKSKPVRSIEDLKGLKLRSPGGHQTNYIKALGAEPIFMPLGDVYMAMETGTVDGLVTCSPLVLAFKLAEVAKYGTVLTLGCVSEGTVMNMKSYNKLDSGQKKIIDEVCTNPFKVTGGLTRDVYKQMIAEISSKGVELIELPDQEKNKWYERFRQVTRDWVKGLEGKGLPAKKAVLTMNEECEKRGVKLVAFPPEYLKG